jgi:hypothetical protein
MRYFVAVAEALSFRKFTNKDCLHCSLSSIALSFRRGGPPRCDARFLGFARPETSESR